MRHIVERRSEFTSNFRISFILQGEMARFEASILECVIELFAHCAKGELFSDCTQNAKTKPQFLVCSKLM